MALAHSRFRLAQASVWRDIAIALLVALACGWSVAGGVFAVVVSVGGSVAVCALVGLAADWLPALLVGSSEPPQATLTPNARTSTSAKEICVRCRASDFIGRMVLDVCKFSHSNCRTYAEIRVAMRPDWP